MNNSNHCGKQFTVRCAAIALAVAYATAWPLPGHAFEGCSVESGADISADLAARQAQFSQFAQMLWIAPQTT